MDKKRNMSRRKAVAAALGSVRAEGLKPSAKTQKNIENYADGKITAKQLRAKTLRSISSTTPRINKK
jgi:hypothetical protein